MKVVIQRCLQASVKVDGQTVGSITHGITALVGITHDDTCEDTEWMAEKLVHLRIFEDDQGKMNRSLLDVGGAVLSISQFTLYGDCRKGRRPNFMQAARPEVAKQLYEQFNLALQNCGIKVECGIFGAMMDVDLVNQGPVTLVLETPPDER